MSVVEYRTHVGRLTVHLVYLDDRRTVCGRNYVTVPDEGGYVCTRCLQIARVQPLRIPERAQPAAPGDDSDPDTRGASGVGNGPDTGAAA